MNNAINLIIFSPGTNIEHGNSLRDRMLEIAKRDNFLLQVQTWQDNEFFGPDNQYALNECIRKLHSFDGAILVLGPQLRPTNNLRRDAIDKLARFARSLFGVPEQVAPNVLIEIGAVMARFGRNRVFLLEPKSKKVEAPSYFAENNAKFHTYDDTVPNISDGMAESAEYVIKEIKELGDTAYFSDLPSFGLAHGNFNAFIKPVIRSIKEGDEVRIDGSITNFKDVVFIIAYEKERVRAQKDAYPVLDRIGLAKGQITQKNGRAITFRTLPVSTPSDVLVIVDVPTNLLPAEYAVNKIDELWAGGVPTSIDYRQILVKKEIENYFRYLSILVREEKLPEDKIRPIPLDDLESLTLDMIENAAR